MNSILDFLEDGVAKHAVTLSEELQARTRANEESSRVLAGTANTAAIVQFFERELVRRTALTDRQRVFHQVRPNFIYLFLHKFSRRYLTIVIALNAMLNAWAHYKSFHLVEHVG